jgi:hypothetical protein
MEKGLEGLPGETGMGYLNRVRFGGSFGPCPDCSRRFFTKDDEERHYRTHHQAP